MRDGWFTLVALILASCASTPAPPAAWAPIERPALVVAAPSASPAGELGSGPAASAEQVRKETWEGEYTCAQGVTAVSLHVTRRDDVSLEAVFMFRASDENPGVPSGAYTLAGQMRADGSFELTPSHWLDQPSNYIMVGMAGTVDREGTTMRGRITESSCGDFELHRLPAR